MYLAFLVVVVLLVSMLQELIVLLKEPGEEEGTLVEVALLMVNLAVVAVLLMREPIK